MEYELPNNMKLTKKERKEAEDKFEPLARSFFEGLVFFIYVPLRIYNKLKRKKNETRNKRQNKR